MHTREETQNHWPSFFEVLQDSGHLDVAVHRKLSGSLPTEEYRLTPYTLFHLIDNEVSFLNNEEFPNIKKMTTDEHNEALNIFFAKAKAFYERLNSDADFRAWLERDKLSKEQREQIARTQAIRALENGYEVMFLKMLNMIPARECKKALQIFKDPNNSPIYSLVRLGDVSLFKKVLSKFPRETRLTIIKARNKKGYNALDGAVKSGSRRLILKILKLYPQEERLITLQSLANNDVWRDDTYLHKIVALGDVKLLQNIFKLLPLAEYENALNTEVYGTNLLGLAAHKGKLAMVKTIINLYPLDKQQDAIEKINTRKRTILFETAYSGNITLFKFIFEQYKTILDRKIAIRRADDSQEILLHEAVRAGNFESFIEILKIYQQYDIIDYALECKNNEGLTFLHLIPGWFYLQNEIKVINELIDTKQLFEALKVKNNDGNTPLHLAANSSNAHALQEFLNAYSSIDRLTLLKIMNNQNCTVLNQAIKRNSFTKNYELLIFTILESLSDKERLELISYSNYFLYDFVDGIIEEKLKINKNHSIIESLHKLLTLFSINDRLQLLQVNTPSRGTVLHLIAEKCDTETFDYVLSLVSATHHADLLQIYNPYVGTVLHCAVRSANVNIAMKILNILSEEELQNISKQSNFFDDTLFHCAISSNNLHIVKFIFNQLAQAESYQILNLADQWNNTVLQLAFNLDNTAILKELLEMLPENERLSELLVKDEKGRTRLSKLSFSSVEDIKQNILSLFPGSKLLIEYINTHSITNPKTVVNWIEGVSERIRVVFDMFKIETDIYKLSDIYDIFTVNNSFYDYAPNPLTAILLSNLFNNYMSYSVAIEKMKVHAQQQFKRVIDNSNEFNIQLVVNRLSQRSLYKDCDVHRILNKKNRSKKRSHGLFSQAGDDSIEETASNNNDKKNNGSTLESDRKRIKLSS